MPVKKLVAGLTAELREVNAPLAPLLSWTVSPLRLASPS